MIRVIVIYKEKSNQEYIKKIGGTVIDNLSKISKLLIADIPEDKLDDLKSQDDILEVELDKEIKIELTDDYSTIPHLIMDGRNYIILPPMTYTTVEMDIMIDKDISKTSRHIFDNRTTRDNTSQSYLNTMTTDLDTFGNCTVFVDGVQKTNKTNFIPNKVRCKVKIQMPSVTSGSSVVFARNGLGYYSYGKIFSIKVSNGEQVVAQYDMSKGNVNDVSGNGKHAFLSAGQWVALETPAPSLTNEVYSNYDGAMYWGLKGLSVKDYWDRGITGKGGKVAIFDISFPKHYYMDNYKDSVSYGSAGAHESGYENGTHGVQVASHIASSTVYTESGFHTGVGNDIELYAVRVYDGSMPTNSQILSSINWTMQRDIKVINFSSLIPYNSTYQSTLVAIDAFIDNDGVFMMSAGNYRQETGTTHINGYNRVVLIGGVDEQFKRWDDGSTGSNFGKNVSFVTIYGTMPYKFSSTPPRITDEMGQARGTSFACPLGAGMFLLYKEAYPDKTNHEVLEILTNNAMKLAGRTGWDKEYGHGFPQPSEKILNMPRVINDGLKFRGLGDHINAGNNTSLDLINNFSIILDLSQNYGNDGYILTKSDPIKLNEQSFYGIKLGHDNKIGNRLTIYYMSGGVFQSEVVPMSISDTRRYKLAIIYKYPNIEVYLNGKLFSTVKMKGTMSSSTVSTGSPNLYIGSSTKVDERSFSGLLYGVKIYNKSLSQSDILNNYNDVKFDETSLVLNYKTDGKENDNIADLSGKGNTGVIKGASPNIRRI